MKNRNAQIVVTIIYVLLSTIILMIPALYNGYPLVTSDTGAYIMMAHHLTPSVMRPLGYSLFIHIFSWFESLWPVVYIQSLILNTVIILTIKTIFNKSTIIPIHFIIIVFLSLFNSLGWYSGQIMTDIFTSILILTLFLLFRAKKLNWWKIILFSIAILWYSAMHYSLMLISIAFIILICLGLIFKKIREKTNPRKVLLKSALVIGCIIVSASAQQLYISTFDLPVEFGGGKNVFIMGRLCESGILKDFLDENCEEQNYSICKYKDELPKTALEFVWNDNSPYKKDTLYLFEADKEYASIVKKIYTSPKYWFRLFVVEGFNQTWKQCYTMRIGHGLWQHKEDGGFYRHFERVFPEETDNYKKSKQFKNKLNFDFINLQNKLTLITSLLVIIITLVIFKLPKTYYQLTFFTIIGYIINAGISANLANVSYRLGGRAAWLIVFIALIYICGIVTNLFTINPFFTKFTRKNLSPHKQR